MSTTTERRRLFDLQEGYCHWCKRQMLWLEPYPARAELPPTAATIDHVYSQLNPLRKGNNPKVAACHQCNLIRNRQDQKEFKAEQTERSNAGNEKKKRAWGI